MSDDTPLIIAGGGGGVGRLGENKGFDGIVERFAGASIGSDLKGLALIIFLLLLLLGQCYSSYISATTPFSDNICVFVNEDQKHAA